MIAARRYATGGLTLALSLLAVPSQAEDLRVCLLDNDLPRANRAQVSGFDYDLFQKVAERLKREFAPVWAASAMAFSEIDGTDLPLPKLLDGECDVVPSVPGELAVGRLRGLIDLSSAYYAAAFEIYMPEVESLDWEGLPEVVGDRRVAVRLQSLGHFAVQAVGLEWTAHTSAAEVVAAVDAGKAAAALVFGPSLSGLRKRPVPVFDPPRGLRFNQHAALRAGDPLGADVEYVLGELKEDGILERLAVRYAISRIEPFATVSTAEAIRALGIGGP